LPFDAPLSYRLVGSTVVPRFLGEADHPWLRTLLEERERFVGRPQREVDARLRAPLMPEGPPGKKQLAVRVLARRGRSTRDAAAPSRQARRLVFAEAVRAPGPRAAILVRVASSLNVRPEELEASLFADLPGERVATGLDPSLSPSELALRANLLLTQTLLSRATQVTLEVEGNARVLVRYAKLRGLICTVSQAPGGLDTMLEVSGPLALFRRTILYGRALGSLVPHLAWCRRFRLRAACLLQERLVDLHLGTGDPILPADTPRQYDSQIEERFAREFRKLAPDWDVFREPEPIVAGSRLVFPDFALQHRHDTSRRWLLEIVGFWTPDYVRRKLALYREARVPNLILCIDEARACDEGDLPAGAVITRFRRRVDAVAVRRILG
jgi:predicted nuclease of restriction endonuclease-like RecB superfamily